jgi:hypothetical protein
MFAPCKEMTDHSSTGSSENISEEHLPSIPASPQNLFVVTPNWTSCDPHCDWTDASGDFRRNGHGDPQCTKCDQSTTEAANQLSSREQR